MCIRDRGTSALNTAALTGESLPRDVQTGDEVISGCVNMTGLLKVKTTKEDVYKRQGKNRAAKAES